MSSTTKGKAKTKASPPLSDQEIQQKYIRLQNEQKGLVNKIGELESEAEEYALVLSTLEKILAEDPNRKCFHLIGGVLAERTVKDVIPALRTNLDGIRKVIATLTEQYTTKEKELESFKQEYNIRLVQ